MKEIGKLPNPDPSDTEPWNREEDAAANKVISVDHIYEASRGDLRKQAQEWAGLEIDPTADLFVFVGRWSVQKGKYRLREHSFMLHGWLTCSGVDLIADVFPAVLDKHKSVQLICIGPVIDLHGKFAALKVSAELVGKRSAAAFRHNPVSLIVSADPIKTVLTILDSLSKS